MPDWASKTLYDRIVDRWKEKESQYSRINRNREVVVRCFRPDELPVGGEQRNSTNAEQNMEFLGQDIYQGSPVHVSRNMATAFQGSLVSKNIDWFKYQMEQYELKGIDQLDIWLQEIKEYMTDVYNRSNFYDVQPQFTLDGLTIGSPLMFADEDILEQRTMWTPQYFRNVRMYYDKFNQINGVIVKDPKWTAKQIADTFILDGDSREDKLTIAVNKSLSAGKLADEYTVYRAVFKVDDQIWDSEDNSFKNPAGPWTWLSVYFLELQTTDNNKKNTPLNKNIGYFNKPFVHWDFEKKLWEAASRTPAWYAIWDCMGLQQVYKNFLENVQYQNRPPVMYLDTMKNKLDLSPESATGLDKSEYQNPPFALKDMVGSVEMNKELSDIYEDALGRWFFKDKFEMFSALVRTGNSPPTATQIFQMAGEKATLLSPAIETHSKYLSDADARMVNIEVAAGRGPFDPRTMANITDIVLSNVPNPDVIRSVGIQPVFTGILAQAQKQSQALEPIQSGLAIAGPLIEVFPQLKLKFREGELLDEALRTVDFPEGTIIPNDEYLERVAAANEAAAKQQQFENSMEALKNSKNVQGPVDENSILAKAAG